jgi:hypothetical protein
MAIISRPTKEQARQWLIERWEGRKPLPNLEQVRLELQPETDKQNFIPHGSVDNCAQPVHSFTESNS